MIDIMTTTDRAGYSDAPRGTERTHFLSVLVEDRPGSVDRVVGLLRRKRANARSVSLGPAETAAHVRITAQVQDSDVSVANLVEHLRKVFDVHQVTSLTTEQAVVRELALVQVNTTADNQQAAIEAAHEFGALVADVTSNTITFEVSGSTDKVARFLGHMETFGVREVARTGAVTLARRADER